MPSGDLEDSYRAQRLDALFYKLRLFFTQERIGELFGITGTRVGQRVSRYKKELIERRVYMKDDGNYYFFDAGLTDIFGPFATKNAVRAALWIYDRRQMMPENLVLPDGSTSKTMVWKEASEALGEKFHHTKPLAKRTRRRTNG